MPATKIKSNKNTLLALAPKAAVADVLKPLLSELLTTTNVSEATKWDGYDFGIEASDQDEDRALTDAAGAATRGYENFGGAVSFYTPRPSDTSSIYRQARNLSAVPHTEMVNVQRDGYAASEPFAAGQVINTYHTITDARNEQRGDKNRYYSVDFKPKGFVGINRIIPSAVATSVAITGGATVAAGASIQLKAAYEGNDITVGAEWVSSDESKAIVTRHGIVIGIAAGSVNITATYPGSAASTPKAITVS
ncbi:Ig-like domain-containing protein [Streptomyces sp. AC495_CC817]|uniref:phage tail tube protein n=1 Tax=Streptomyces sp. AC495_CC817 TaxID=2823900 RepID=UPI001C278B80|nr:Ig-like domain-containing protein [Streptomyces sp. AC495_CC817]